MELDDDAKKWLKDAMKESGEKIKNSHIFTSLITEGYFDDPLCCLQIGYAIMHDKPIILIVDKAVKVPAHLVRVAKRIERIDMKDRDAVRKVTQSLMEEFK